MRRTITKDGYRTVLSGRGGFDPSLADPETGAHQAYVRRSFTHVYHADYPGLPATREALLGLGRRLVAEGRLDRAANVFFLARDELGEAILDASALGLQPLVAKPAIARERARATSPVPFLRRPSDDDAEGLADGSQVLRRRRHRKPQQRPDRRHRTSAGEVTLSPASSAPSTASSACPQAKCYV